MKIFEITNTTSGQSLGTVRALDKADALEVLAKDAGYVSYAAACDVSFPESGEVLVTECHLERTGA